MFYDIAFFIFSIFYLPTLIFKGKLHKDFGERFASYDSDKLSALRAAKDVIWIQAVSVGESALCRPLIPLLKARFPKSTIVFSTITKTGNDLAKKLYSDDAIIIYFPLDFSFVVKRTVDLIRPKIYIMVETEIWPNVIKELARRSVPSMIINGRISDRSFGKYMAAKPFLLKILSKISKFCMQSREDAERIIAMGAPQDKVVVAGNMKLDIKPSAGRSSAIILEELGLKEGEGLLVAGSTHAGEERIVLDVYRDLLEGFPDLRLLIAPRHVERSSVVERTVKSFGFEAVMVSKVSQMHEPPGAARVLILDTIGKLTEAYSVAILVFIGGSFIPHGGQNPIEPAALGKAVVFGPHMFNFKSIVSLLLEKEGAVQAKNKEELLKKAYHLLKDLQYRTLIARNAKSVIADNRGASARCVEEIAKLLDE